jgi:hypothetical protein
LHRFEDNPQRLSKYIKFKDELRFDDIPFPVRIDDYKKCERLNETISINVFEYKIKLSKNKEILKVYPIYLVYNRTRKS